MQNGGAFAAKEQLPTTSNNFHFAARTFVQGTVSSLAHFTNIEVGNPRVGASFIISRSGHRHRRRRRLRRYGRRPRHLFPLPPFPRPHLPHACFNLLVLLLLFLLLLFLLLLMIICMILLIISRIILHITTP